MRIRLCFGRFLLIAMLTFCSSAKGAIIVSFGGPANVAAGGGSGLIDVFVSSSTGADRLDLFSAEFLLTPVIGPAGGLQFGTQLEAQLSQGNYVHAGNSAGSPIGNVSGVNNETYIGGDSTADFAGTLLQLDPNPPNNPLQYLLFRLNLTTTTALTGDQYTITLVNDPSTTFFLDDTFADLTIDPLSFTNAGTINITAAAVPEPSSIVLLSTILGGYVWRSRQRKIGKST